MICEEAKGKKDAIVETDMKVSRSHLPLYFCYFKKLNLSILWQVCAA